MQQRAPVRVVVTRALVPFYPDLPGEIEVPARSVAELLDGLEARWPGIRDRLADSRPAIRRHISVFVDGHRATLQSELAPGAEVYVLTAMSGG